MSISTIAELIQPVRRADPAQLGTKTIKYIDIASIDREAKNVSVASCIDAVSAPSRARQLLITDDVLISTVRPNLNAVAIVPSHLNGSIGSTGFCVLRAETTRLLPDYLFYYSQSSTFVAHLTRIANGASYPAVSDDDILETTIPLPPLAEQNRIANLLKSVDRMRRMRRYALRACDEFLPAAFFELFGDPISNNKLWPVIAVEEAGKVQLGRQRAPKYQTGQFRTPYIRVANVYENEIDLSDLLYMDFDPSDFAAYKLEHGDILLNEGQSTELVGRPAMWRSEIPDCCFQNTLVRFQADRNVCDPVYALWLFINYLHGGEFAKISAKTSNVAHLGAFRLAQMRFPLPPLAKQQQFSALAEQHERLRAVQRRSLREAEHLYQTLLHQAFNPQQAASA